MSLHNGLDTVGIVSGGVYSVTYGSTGQKFINNLYASLGFLEDAPDVAPPSIISRSKTWLLFFLKKLKK